MSVTPDPHKPLRDDVRLLGELLGQAIRAREGDRTFARVERVRALAKSGRSDDSSAFDTLAAELGAMPLDEVLPVARLFAFLNLATRRAAPPHPAPAAPPPVARPPPRAVVRGALAVVAPLTRSSGEPSLARY